MSAVARRYAQAGVEAAEQSGGTEAVESLSKDIRLFAGLYKESEDLRELLLNPALTGQSRAVLDELSKKLGLSQTGHNLVRILADNDRMRELGEVASEIAELADQRLGRNRARVVSAVPLSTDQLERISKGLEKRFSRPVVIDTEVDPGIVGGLICTVGSTTFDNSIRRQLEIISERLHAH